MKFSKKKLCDLARCYAVSQTSLNGRTLILLAPDAPGPCYSIDSQTLVQQTVWEGPSGTMSLIPRPGKNGDFLAVQRFNPGFQAREAEVVYASFQDNHWQVRTLFKLPYVHRFDILERAGVNYILGCTLCDSKRFEEDWSSPGRLYAAELPENINQPLSLIPIAGEMYKNHGYRRVQNTDYSWALTACEQGVFEVLPPEKRGSAWQVNKIFDRPVSDLAICDIDGDGVPELATIEPFHGSNFCVYHKTREGYSLIYRYPADLPFGHAIWGGRLRSQPVFIGGGRAGKQELFMLRQEGGQIVSEIIDTGCGPANVSVITGDKQDWLVAANHAIGEGAVYIVQDT